MKEVKHTARSHHMPEIKHVILSCGFFRHLFVMGTLVIMSVYAIKWVFPWRSLCFLNHCSPFSTCTVKGEALWTTETWWLWTVPTISIQATSPQKGMSCALRYLRSNMYHIYQIWVKVFSMAFLQWVRKELLRTCVYFSIQMKTVYRT